MATTFPYIKVSFFFFVIARFAGIVIQSQGFQSRLTRYHKLSWVKVNYMYPYCEIKSKNHKQRAVIEKNKKQKQKTCIYTCNFERRKRRKKCLTLHIKSKVLIWSVTVHLFTLFSFALTSHAMAKFMKIDLIILKLNKSVCILWFGLLYIYKKFGLVHQSSKMFAYQFY